MQAWFLRHSSDLEGEQSQAFIKVKQKPSAGIVSWLFGAVQFLNLIKWTHKNGLKI